MSCFSRILSLTVCVKVISTSWGALWRQVKENYGPFHRHFHLSTLHGKDDLHPLTSERHGWKMLNEMIHRKHWHWLMLFWLLSLTFLLISSFFQYYGATASQSLCNELCLCFSVKFNMFLKKESVLRQKLDSKPRSTNMRRTIPTSTGHWNWFKPCSKQFCRHKMET